MIYFGTVGIKSVPKIRQLAIELVGIEFYKAPKFLGVLSTQKFSNLGKYPQEMGIESERIFGKAQQLVNRNVEAGNLFPKLSFCNWNIQLKNPAGANCVISQLGPEKGLGKQKTTF